MYSLVVLGGTTPPRLDELHVMQWNCFRAGGVQRNLYILGDLVLDALFARVFSYLLHFPDNGSYPVQRASVDWVRH
jgi:hypothetical protein